MALNEFIKKSLRITTDVFDEEVNGLIEACKADLQRVGISVDEKDALIVRAVVFYCKAYFGYDDTAAADKNQAAYEKLRQALALTAEYRGDESKNAQ